MKIKTIILFAVISICIHFITLYILNTQVFVEDLPIGESYSEYQYAPFPYTKSYVPSSACSSGLSISETCSSYTYTSSKGLSLSIILSVFILVIAFFIARYRKVYIILLALIVIGINLFVINYYDSKFKEVGESADSSWFY